MCCNIHDGACTGEGLYLEQTSIITDADVPCYGKDGVWQEADGFYTEDGMITEDSKKKKKAKTINS